MDDHAIAILGGTGDQGLGLALRFCRAGRHVVIGSRKAERAVRAAEEVIEAVPGARVEGFENDVAASRARIVILSVPFEHAASTVKGVAHALRPGQVLVSMGVPLATAIGGRPTQTLEVWQGSCAELVASLAPEGVETVSAFQNVPAHRLADLKEPVECDAISSGPKEARELVMELCPLVPGMRAIDGGPLSNARMVEGLTALLIGINQRYQIPKGTGVRITGLPKD